LTGSRFLGTVLPVRAALSLFDSLRAPDLLLVQAVDPQVQSLGGGVICDTADAASTSASTGGTTGGSPDGSTGGGIGQGPGAGIGEGTGAADSGSAQVATGPASTETPTPTADPRGVAFADPALAVPLAPPGTSRPVISPEDLAESLGLGPDGLPEERRAGRLAVPAPSDAPEFALLAPANQLVQAADLISSVGGTALRGESLPNLGLQLIVVDLAGGVADTEIRALLQQGGVDAAFDANHLFEAGQGRRTYANQLVGAVPVDSCRLPVPVRIGLIDGPVDNGNPYVRGMNVTAFTAIGSDVAVGAPEHATGIASLMAAPPSEGFAGIAPGAELMSAIAFARYDDRDAASMESIARSLDWLLGQEVSVINMSIAGPYNEVFGRLLGIAADRGAVLVAASGNDAASDVAYPGADPNVIAVTALDAAKRLYRDASVGEAVEFAAPGVDVLVAEGDGTAYRSGTSYAAAVLSALIAHEIGNGKLGDREAVRDILRAASEDLGESGRDVLFGWGLPKLPECGTAAE
jgi:hypothetical protein